MTLLEVVAELSKQAEALKAKNENFEAMIIEHESLKAEYEAFKGQAEVDKQAKYDEGFQAGVASVPPCPECPPPQDPELQVKLDEALAKIAELESSVVAMQGQIQDLQAQLVAKDQEKVEAVAQALRDAKAKLDEAEASIFPA